MALQKQAINIGFNQGLDTKTDPKQVQLGNFLALQNSVFDKAGALSKRNGFANITTLPNSTQTTLTTLNDNLLATGSNLYAYSADTNQWLNQGVTQPVQLNTQALVRSSTSQSSPDSALADSGLLCLVYVDSGSAYYQISDSLTGQQIVSRQALPATARNPRVFLLGRYFIITFVATVSATPHLQYIAVPISVPTSPGSATDISATMLSLTAGYDAIVANDSLYISWEATAAIVKIAYMSSTLVVSTAVNTTTSHAGSIISVTAEINGSNNVVWTTYWDTNTNLAYTAAYTSGLVPILAETQIASGLLFNGLTSISNGGVLYVFYEANNTYSYAPNAKTDYIATRTVTQAGVVSAQTIILRSVGLASKPFIDEPSNTIYLTATYGETNQPTYFLIDYAGNIYMRLAYANGGGYEPSQVLPTISPLNGIYYMPYSIKDFLASVNKGTALPSGTPTNGIYTQTGINLAKFSINDRTQYSSEIASALHLTGGQLWEYDGVRPVEHGFHVWPENVAATTSSTSGSMVAGTYYYAFTYEWTDNAGNLHRSAPSIPLLVTVATPPGTFTGNRTSGSAVISSISSTANLQVGQAISGTGIPASTFILSVDSSTQITMTNNASSGSATSTTITPIAATSVTINVPTLRLTYKRSPNPVRIVGYRWSTNQQVYYQFTSITSPTVNSTTTDSVAISDTNSDAQILGQTLLYTTGGVVENIAAPASTASALFKNRLFLIDAEDRNLLWFSKQVIQNVPVEMSDLLTLYIAPTSGAQGSTGPMSALSAMDDKLIIFKKDAIYYITGNGPDNTGVSNDFSDAIFITSSVGCDNPSSIVLMPNGLMFQSDKGIWLLGRDLQTTYIGAGVEQYNDNVVMSANSIPGTNQVRFILDNNITLMYDYYYGQWGTFNNTFAISGTLFNGLHTYLNSYGLVFQETPGMYLDGTRPVLLSFITSWISIAGIQGYERFYQLLLLGNYYTPFTLNVQIAYDFGSSPSQAVVVTPDNQTGDWGDDPQWGSNGPWGGPGNILRARVFPQIQKCETFQLTVSESYDSTYSQPAGKGLSLSGLNLTVGVKKGSRTQKASTSFG